MLRYFDIASVMNIRFARCFSLVLLCSVPGFATGQAKDSNELNCKSILLNADNFYRTGQYEQCVSAVEKLLQGCELKRREEERVFELLGKSYTELNDPAKASRAVETMLSRSPHYELKDSENFEAYNRLVKKYRIHPLFSIGARNVILWTGFNTTRVFTLPEGSANSNPYRTGDYFFTYYGWAEIEFNNGISLNGDLMWWTAFYKKEYKIEPVYDIYYSENPEFVEIPLYIKKYFKLHSDLRPYAAAGLGWLYMTKSAGYVSKYDNSKNVTTYISNIDMIEMRTRHNFEWVIGTGLGYKLKNVGLFFDVRYYGGLTSLTNPDHRNDNEILLSDFYYVDNSIKMNKFEIGVSLSYTFINSVKKLR
jgi:hypothetical protein